MFRKIRTNNKFKQRSLPNSSNSRSSTPVKQVHQG